MMQRTLEGLNFIFAVPSRTFIEYQVTKMLPYWNQCYGFRNKSACLEPLYHFEGVVADKSEVRQVVTVTHGGKALIGQ